MAAKVVLIVVGSIILILGILLLIASFNHDYEMKAYKKIVRKTPPDNLKHTSMAVSIVLSLIGLALLIWGLMIHSGHAYL